MEKKSLSKKSIVLILFLLAFVVIRNHFRYKSEEEKKNQTRVINVAHTVTNVPYDFLDENGNADGFEIAVLKAVDELLPEYEFQFHGVSDEELLIGTESGKYQL